MRAFSGAAAGSASKSRQNPAVVEDFIEWFHPAGRHVGFTRPQHRDPVSHTVGTVPPSEPHPWHAEQRPG